MTALTIDHVTVAGSDLDALRTAFAGAGLASEYGGVHSNGVTHMAVTAFGDGSYIELISRLAGKAGADAWWSEHIARDAGPCGWAVRVADVDAESERLRSKGVAVDGPHHFSRHRPDGILAEWDLSFVGPGEPGTVFPFIINDCTPRSHRVSETAQIAGGAIADLLSGVAGVVIGVADLDAAIHRFSNVYDWLAPLTAQDSTLGLHLAHFDESPVILASPADPQNWLAERLSLFGDGPCAYLIGCRSIEQAARHFPISEPVARFGHGVAWIQQEALANTRLALVE